MPFGGVVIATMTYVVIMLYATVRIRAAPPRARRGWSVVA